MQKIILSIFFILFIFQLTKPEGYDTKEYYERREEILEKYEVNGPLGAVKLYFLSDEEREALRRELHDLNDQRAAGEHDNMNDRQDNPDLRENN